MRILILATFVVTSSAWNCGIGPFSGALSYAIAFPSDVPGVNNCCMEHDALVEGLHVAREEADRIFCQCLSGHNNWYVRSVVKPIFCTTVNVYTAWVDRQKKKEEMKQIGDYFNMKEYQEFRYRRLQ